MRMDQRQPDDGTDPLDVRVYDVRDLTLVVQDYPLSGSLVVPTDIGKDALQAQQQANHNGATSSLTPMPPPRLPETPTERLVQVIQNNVDNGSWKTYGGSYGSVSSFEGELVITQIVDNQAHIAKLLADLRAGRSATVRVRADWVLLPQGQIEQLFKNGPDDKSALPEVRRELLDKIAHCTADVSCFSGQTVHLASGKAVSMVTSIEPVVGQGAMGYESKAEIVQYGPALQVMPAVSAGSATLDLMGEACDGADPAVTLPAEHTVDRINAVVQHFHTTVQLPLNTPVLVERATAEPGMNQPKFDQLCLIVEVDAK
jgi:hypothetical protein